MPIYSVPGLEFLSTLPARGATFLIQGLQHLCIISIHAPREGSDGVPQHGCQPVFGISIHAPREGSDLISSAAVA